MTLYNVNKDKENESKSTVKIDVKKLYIMHFCFSFISRMWDMAITLLVAIITNNSLLIVAMSGFLSSFLIFMLMPTIGIYIY
jgi:hypothetical protein